MGFQGEITKSSLRFSSDDSVALSIAAETKQTNLKGKKTVKLNTNTRKKRGKRATEEKKNVKSEDESERRKKKIKYVCTQHKTANEMKEAHTKNATTTTTKKKKKKKNISGKSIRLLPLLYNYYHHHFIYSMLFAWLCIAQFNEKPCHTRRAISFMCELEKNKIQQTVGYVD